jgi:hypothetical protein
MTEAGKRLCTVVDDVGGRIDIGDLVKAVEVESFDQGVATGHHDMEKYHETMLKTLRAEVAGMRYADETVVGMVSLAAVLAAIDRMLK